MSYGKRNRTQNKKRAGRFRELNRRAQRFHVERDGVTYEQLVRDGRIVSERAIGPARTESVPDRLY